MSIAVTLFDKEITTRVGVLALDVATKTGFCTENGSGVWNFTPKKVKGVTPADGKRLEDFHDTLVATIHRQSIKIVVYEGPAVFGKFPNFVGIHMHGIVEFTCHRLGIQCAQVSPPVLKKWATGKGNADKSQMILAAQRYKAAIKSDDEADAILLYYHSLEHLQIQP